MFGILAWVFISEQVITIVIIASTFVIREVSMIVIEYSNSSYLFGFVVGVNFE